MLPRSGKIPSHASSVVNVIDFSYRANVAELADTLTKLDIKTISVDHTHAGWDDFVRAAGGDLVQTTMWGMSKRALGQEVALVEARDSDGALVGGALLVVRRVGPGLRIGYVARRPVTPIS